MIQSQGCCRHPFASMGLMSILIVWATLVSFAETAVAAGGMDLEPKTLARIPAGTRFGEDPPQGWSNIILFVEGELSSGDVAAASETVKYYSKIFNLVMLANVAKGESGQFVLDKVGIGFSMNINGKNTVITANAQAQLGANLSFIGKSVLSGNEEALADVKQVARYSNGAVIDAPTMMLRNGQHQLMMVRYVLWVSPQDGRLGTAVWLMDKGNSSQDYSVVEDTFQLLPPNMREKRVMNVMGNRFTLGIPAKDAFALVRIPQGTPYKFTNELRAIAGRIKLDGGSYGELMKALDAAMR